VIAYSLIFSSEGIRHPLPSGSELFTGKASPSTGLSRSFSAILRLQFAEATRYNPHGIRIFVFFITQLFLRLGITFLLSRMDQLHFQRLLYADLLVSAALFLTLFWPFFTHLFRQFST
jgi:hypothetical protein